MTRFGPSHACQSADSRIRRRGLVWAWGFLGFLIAFGNARGEKLVLTWKDRSGIETGYIVEVRVGEDGVFENVLGPPENGQRPHLEPNTTAYEYTIDEADKGKTLSFRVFAFNDYGESGHSNRRTLVPPSLALRRSRLTEVSADSALVEIEVDLIAGGVFNDGELDGEPERITEGMVTPVSSDENVLRGAEIEFKTLNDETGLIRFDVRGAQAGTTAIRLEVKGKLIESEALFTLKVEPPIVQPQNIGQWGMAAGSSADGLNNLSWIRNSPDAETNRLLVAAVASAGEGDPTTLMIEPLPGRTGAEWVVMAGNRDDRLTALWIAPVTIRPQGFFATPVVIPDIVAGQPELAAPSIAGGPVPFSTVPFRAPSIPIDSLEGLAAGDRLEFGPGTDGFFHVDETGLIERYGLGYGGRLLRQSGELQITDAGLFQSTPSVIAGIDGSVSDASLSGYSFDEGSAFRGTRQESFGSTSSFEGRFEGWITPATHERIEVIAGADGLALVNLETEAGAIVRWTQLDSSGRMHFLLPDILELDARLEPDNASTLLAGTVSGTVTYFDRARRLAGPAADEPGHARLVNLSLKTRIAGGTEALIVGFVVEGNGANRILLRGVGPSLSEFGVAEPLADPLLRLRRNAIVFADNDDWDGSIEAAMNAAADQVGAFLLAAGSRDSALIVEAPAGLYTSVVRSIDASGGVVLAELYELAEAGVYPDALLQNMSSRLRLGEGRSAAMGFSIKGERARQVLVRAIGPSLSDLGVTDSHADPRISFLEGREGGGFAVIETNEDWADRHEAVIAEAASKATGFLLAPDSKDAALLLWLAAGNYQVQVSGPPGTSGSILIELYVVP